MATRTTLTAGEPPGILVFVDLCTGELDDAGKGILSEAQRLAKKLNSDWSAVAFTGAEITGREQFGNYETKALTLIEAPAEVADSFTAQGKLVAQFVAQQGAKILLLPHNDLGGVLAALVAAELQGALFTEALSYQPKGDGLLLSRTVLGDQVAETKIWDGSAPLVLTMHPRVLSAVVMPFMKRCDTKVSTWKSAQAVELGATRIVERIPPDPQTVDVSDAEVIISAGLGCEGKHFALVEELTLLLGGSLGVTRPVYDNGRAGFERMVGQTGKTVSPRFYLALGISGSMHHLGGIKDSKKIISVNIDSKVPIFPNSDEGFVADLREVLPLLIERVKLATGGGV